MEDSKPKPQPAPETSGQEQDQPKPGEELTEDSLEQVIGGVGLLNRKFSDFSFDKDRTVDKQYPHLFH